MNKRRRWKAKARRRQPAAPLVAIDMGGQTWHFRPTGEPVGWLRGLKPIAPFTLNINWGPPTLPCGVCSAPVAMPADGQPLPQLEHNGTSSPLCDPCAMALMSTAD
jgi:hypothetical protein